MSRSNAKAVRVSPARASPTPASQRAAATAVQTRGAVPPTPASQRAAATPVRPRGIVPPPPAPLRPAAKSVRLRCVVPPTRAEHERALRVFLDEHPQRRGLPWVFAYGSLLWRPEFEEAARLAARVHGWHRSLNVLAIAARGTTARPGLWFGLARGGSVNGVLIRPRANAMAALLDLWTRELPDDAYVPRWVRAQPSRGAACWAIAFASNPASRLYAPGLSLDECARRVRAAKGYRGSNAEYVLETARHLRELGLRDACLGRLCARLE